MKKYANPKILGIGVIALLAIAFVAGINTNTHAMSMEQKREHFISLKEDIQDHNRQNHDYRCCLEDSCTYCIEKTPGHGEGSACDCLADIMNGVHPCGECIGEILEGHGNKYLAEHFAKAIAEEVGEEHIDTLRIIIEQKYGVSVADQQ